MLLQLRHLVNIRHRPIEMEENGKSAQDFSHWTVGYDKDYSQLWLYFR
jgi:hypothetical protein